MSVLQSTLLCISSTLAAYAPSSTLTVVVMAVLMLAAAVADMSDLTSAVFKALPSMIVRSEIEPKIKPSINTVRTSIESQHRN